MEVADLIPKVVDQMKLNGQVRPTVHAQFDLGIPRTYPLLHFEGDGRLKAHLLFVEGRRAGQQHRDRDLVETIFVSEIWLTAGQPNPNPGGKPSAGIRSKEAVMFARAVNRAPFETHIQTYAIKRKQGKPKELVVFGEATIDPEGLMGLAFLAGWRSRHLNDEEVQQLQPRGMRAFLTLEQQTPPERNVQ